ncbi:MAG: DUF493 domain-containing protein [Chitinivibrionia bacterium]|nr:DUF493 domain-containing protein [Chitinivibrionia bacterium]
MNETKKPIDFPCSYPLKVIGKNSLEFVAVVCAIVERHVPGENGVSYSTRLSTGGKYLSLTATFQAESREQLAFLYKELNHHELVVMAL